jgi:putative phage-type endonuclease
MTGLLPEPPPVDTLITPTARVLSTAPPGSPAWHSVRGKAIGGSALSAIMGDNPYRSAYQEYLRMTGERVEDVDSPRIAEAAYWGHALEGVIADEFVTRYATESGVRYSHVECPTLVDTRVPYRIANPDRLLDPTAPEDDRALLEMKSTGVHLGGQWDDDEIPAHALWQVLHYLLVTSLPVAFVACLIGGQRFVWREVRPDPELFAAIEAAEADFWDHVQRRVPPPPDGSPDATRILRQMYRDVVPGSVVELDADAIDVIRAYAEASSDEKSAATRKTEAANKLRAMLGEYEVGRYGGRIVVSNKLVGGGEKLDVAALAKDEPETYQRFLRDVPGYRRLTVKTPRSLVDTIPTSTVDLP